MGEVAGIERGHLTLPQALLRCRSTWRLFEFLLKSVKFCLVLTVFDIVANQASELFRHLVPSVCIVCVP